MSETWGCGFGIFVLGRAMKTRRKAQCSLCGVTRDEVFGRKTSTDACAHIGSVLIGPSFILTNDLTAGSAKMKFTRKQLFGLSVAILLFGGGVWANVVDGSLYQNKGAWVSHAIK
jgi:hypothetical protein